MILKHIRSWVVLYKPSLYCHIKKERFCQTVQLVIHIVQTDDICNDWKPSLYVVQITCPTEYLTLFCLYIRNVYEVAESTMIKQNACWDEIDVLGSCHFLLFHFYFFIFWERWFEHQLTKFLFSFLHYEISYEQTLLYTNHYDIYS